MKMSKTIKIVLFFCIYLFSYAVISAQGPPDPGDTGGGDVADATPIDMLILIGLVLGIIIGIKALRSYKKS